MEKPDVVYFKFEEEFVEDGVRCIPMIVRLKLDLCGIKLQLKEWSKFSPSERKALAEQDCFHQDERLAYRHFLSTLIETRTGHSTTTLAGSGQFAWQEENSIPQILVAKLKEFGWTLSLSQWKALTPLQRFALLKLCRPGHENRNFPRAFAEFGLAPVK